MNAICEILTRAAKTGELIRISSAIGSTPRIFVPVKVKSVTEDQGSCLVEKVDEFETTVYRLRFILWTEDGLGVRTPNPLAIAEHAKAVERRKERRQLTRSLQSAVDATELSLTSDIQVVKEVQGTENGMPCTFFVLRNAYFNRTAIIRATDVRYAKRICCIFSEGVSLWETMDLFLKGGLLWPLWVRLHQEARNAADVKRDGRPRLRDRDPNLTEKAVPTYGEWTAQLEIYLGAEAVTSFDTRSKNVQLLDYIESDELDYRGAFTLPHLLSPESLRTYIAKAWNAHQIFTPSDGMLTPSDLVPLLRAGLVISADRAPINVLLRGASATALWAPLKARGIKLIRERNAYRRFYESNLTLDMEREIRASPYLRERFVLLPPKQWSWERLQDFRYLYVRMLRSLSNWLTGLEDYLADPRFENLV